MYVRSRRRLFVTGKKRSRNRNKFVSGEIIEIKVGERVPFDGIMLGDVAAFNTAALTGESVPRNIRTGEDVLAGMIVTDRVVRVKVTKPYGSECSGPDSEMVQNASERKAPANFLSGSLPGSTRPWSRGWPC